MNKFIILGFTLILVLLSCVSVFAGDVPESLLYEDTAQVFLGTVENYITKERPSAPYTEIDLLECIPTEKIKGDVEIGAKQSYKRCHCSIDFKPDIEYLFGYFDDNNVYIYEIESRENGKFKLVDSDIHDMTKRLEEALNNGLFEQAEQSRIEKAEKRETSNTPVIGGADQPTAIYVNSNISIWQIIGIGVLFVILSAGIILIIKKK